MQDASTKVHASHDCSINFFPEGTSYLFPYLLFSLFHIYTASPLNL